MDIGDTIRFTPFAWADGAKETAPPSWMQRDVLGTVEHINAAHGFYRVAYTVQTINGPWTGHECFKLVPPPSGEPPERRPYDTYNRKHKKSESREGQKTCGQ